LPSTRGVQDLAHQLPVVQVVGRGYVALAWLALLGGEQVDPRGVPHVDVAGPAIRVHGGPLHLQRVDDDRSRGGGGDVAWTEHRAGTHDPYVHAPVAKALSDLSGVKLRAAVVHVHVPRLIGRVLVSSSPQRRSP